MSIPGEELDRIKREISLVRLVEAQGVKLTGKGDNLMGLCPLHDDKSPSLVVSPAKNIWHCLGACQTGGSVIDWVMKTKRVSFRLAVEMLKKETASLVAEVTPTTEPLLEPIAESPEEPDAVVMRRSLDYYHATLKDAPEALEYLESRGLKHAEMIDRFRLGYGNRTLGYRIPKTQLRAGLLLRAQFQRIGLFRESGHEHFSGCLVVPIFGEDGAVREVYGRKIHDRGMRPGTPKHLYLPKRDDRGVFNLEAFKASKEIILCEALIDALTFWCAGLRNVTSAYGVEGFTAELRQALLDHGTQKLLIAYDRDDAGDRAAEKLARDLSSTGIEIFRVLFPRGMDANEYAAKVQPASRSLETALRGATWMAGTRPVSVVEAIEAEILTPGPLVELEPAAEASAVAVEPPHDPITGEVLAEETPSLAAPVPTRPAIAIGGLQVEEREEEIRVQLGDRLWRVRGIAKNTSYESLRLNLLVARGDDYFVDTFEVYSARLRAAFLKQAADELKLDEAILKSDLGKLVLWIEDRIHQQIDKALQPEEKVEMGEADRAAALAFLKDPKLLHRVLADFDKAGVVGEENNKLMGYLAGVSRKLEAPLAVVIQSSSAAGKSSLMDAVLRFMPEEDRVQYSAMTGQSLFYMGETNLAHKILAIAEEEGAQSASYALKLLQSEGELTIASTGKDPTSGKHVTHEYRVKGPVMIFLTTTAIEVDEELLNRCLILTVDEGPKQTAAIHERQRESQTLEGLLAREDRDAIVGLHQNAQRLLEPLFVANPFAKSLKFASHATRTRRDHMKYLTLIRAIALLHQHQRPIKEVEHRGKRIRYVEVTKADIEIADRLAAGFIFAGLDELPPQTRRLLLMIDTMVSEEAKRQGIEKAVVRFSRKDVRRYTQWTDSALKKHVTRLEALEHLLVHSGGSRRRVIYELAYQYDRNWSPQEGIWSPPGHPLGTPGGRPDFLGDSAMKTDLVTLSEKGLIRPSMKKPSYVKANGKAL